MKKNLALLCVLIFLFFIAYQSEEIFKVEEKNKQDVAAKLFDFSKLGGIKELITPNASLVWKNGLVYSKDSGIIVSKYHLETLLDILANIEVKRHLKDTIKKDSSSSTYRDFLGEKPLSLVFVFNKGRVKFTIGKKIQYSQNFYILVELNNADTKLVVAQDKTPLEGVYQKEGFETNSRKYQRLVSLLYLKNSYFYEKLVFSNLIKNKKIKKIGFSSFRNPEFFVDIQLQSTFPAPPRGIMINKKNIHDLIRDLHNLQAKNVTKLSSENILSKSKGLISIYYTDQKMVEFELFSKLNNTSGLYIKRSGQAFSIQDDDHRLLFSHLQGYWNKKLPFPLKDSSLVIFKNKKQIFKGNISDSVINKISRDKKLIELFGIYSYFIKTADKVSNIDLNIKKLLNNAEKYNILYMKYHKKVFSIIFEKNDTMIVNLSDGYVLHFDGNDIKTYRQFIKKYKGIVK